MIKQQSYEWKFSQKKPGRASKQTPGSSELTDRKVNFKQKHSKLWN